MKYIKTYETQKTPDNILDLFTDRIQSIILDDYELRVERTKGSYKLVITDNNKIIGRLYIQDIKKKGDKFYAEVRRVHVNDDYRDKGLGSKLLQKVIEIFGDFNLYLYPSPNRIKDLTSDNKEEYRDRLVNFYGKYGFKKVGDSNRMERYNENIITNVKRKLINKNLEVRKYEYGVTVPTNGEVTDAAKNFCLKNNWIWYDDSYASWAFGRGVNGVVNYISDYERVPSDEMIKKWAIKDDERFKGRIFLAGADYALNYQFEKEAEKYNL